MPNPLRIAARVLMGSTYVLLGADAVRAPGKRPDQAAATIAAIRKVVPLPVNDTQLVQANAAVQVAGGVLLAAGRAPRLAALAILASMIPTTAAGHAFWAVDDPAARKLQKIQFLKNMAMTGGLLLAVADRG